MIPDPLNSMRDGADPLVPGYYLIQRARQNRVALPVRVFFGPPVDPDTGDVLDRAWRWQIHIAGQAFGDDPVRVGSTTFSALSDFWPLGEQSRITREEYEFRLARAAWASENDPNDAFADWGRRIDPMTTSLPVL